MIDTWRDSWFEEGSRLIYILPESAVNAMLPLEIDPTPRTDRACVCGPDRTDNTGDKAGRAGSDRTERYPHAWPLPEVSRTDREEHRRDREFPVPDNRSALMKPTQAEGLRYWYVA